ncbi:MAG: sulfurtransferase TusA family protein [Psychrobium sp.]|nr:sulfurtransferase TusA family protein [Psychrobium sp.]
MITLDFTHSCCPIPLVQTKLHLKTTKVSDRFIIILSDPGSLSDVPKLIKKLGHEIILMDKTCNNDVVYQITVTV